MESPTLFGITTMAYIIAMIIYIIYLAFKKPQIGLTATTVTIIGFVSHTFGILLRWNEFYEIGRMGILRAAPFTNLYESLIFFLWCLIGGYLIIEFKYKNRSFGAFVTPIAGLALAFIDLTGVSKEIQPLVPALQSNWLLAHVVMSFIAYSAFALAFSTGLMYLIVSTEQQSEASYIFWTVTVGIFVVLLAAMGLDFLTYKLFISNPDILIKSFLLKASFFSQSTVVAVLSWIIGIGLIFLCWKYGYLLKKVIASFSLSPETLDEITYKSIAVGFPIFTLGGLIFGAIWADQAWGVYWSWDPKETWSLISWFAYAFYLHSRLLRGWKGKKIAIVAVVGFVMVIFTYLGVNLLLSGLHSYGSME
ncbi:MAG TPA: c-type cytochrome biogenesis protein CcsB [Thermodesulfovibrionales bacterium]|nr:c-type cytochrome biogenesis protein CcsB [Thermodesulfovibrionales bacterium]